MNAPTIDALFSEVKQLRDAATQNTSSAEIQALKQENLRLNTYINTQRNDINFEAMTLLEIGRITGLPADKKLSDLVEWVRAHWKP